MKKLIVYFLLSGPISAIAAPFAEDSLSGVDGLVISTNTYTPTLGTWVRHSSYTLGSFIFDTGHARSVDGNQSGYYMTPTPPSANYYVETPLYQRDGTIAGMGPTGRMDIGSNTMYLTRGNSTGSQWQLLRLTSGTAVTISTVAMSTVNLSTYTLRLSMIGSSITVSLNGSVIISTVDASPVLLTGRAGMRGGTGGGSGQWPISFLAEPYASSATFTGPASGTVGEASTNFTWTPGAGYYGTITPSDGGGGGSFTPATVTGVGTAAALTFTYTAGSAGAKTISVSDSWGTVTTTPSSIGFTASAAEGGGGGGGTIYTGGVITF